MGHPASRRAPGRPARAVALGDNDRTAAWAAPAVRPRPSPMRVLRSWIAFAKNATLSARGLTAPATTWPS